MESFLLIIVDYGNELHKLINIVEKCYFDVVAVSLKNVYGSANQRNIGVFFARKFIDSDYILFIDSDVVILDNEFFCKLNNIVENLRTSVAINHLLFNYNGSIQWSGAKLLGPFLLEFKNSKMKKSEFLHGAFFSLKCNIVDMIIQERKYLFPPVFYIGFDDYVLSLILHYYGLRSFPVLNIAKIIHIGGSSISRISEKRLYEAMKNLVIGFALANRKKLLIGIIPEYIFFSVIRSMLNRKMNVLNILRSLIRGLVSGIMYL